PHFLFNTLATVRRLYQTDLAKGRSILHNLMRYLEVALPQMRARESDVQRELALVESYLAVQKIRMDERLVFSFDVPAAMRGLPLPPMMLLTLVENAIKHGLNPLPQGGSIHISARVAGSALEIEVVDTGRGFHATSGGGAGLANIQARLSALHGSAASLELRDNEPHGVVSTLRLPFEATP
ncbi:MAG: histidine kinase, partial [Caldimonas sp.]